MDTAEVVTIYRRQPQESGRQQQQQQKPYLPVLPAYAVTYHKAQGQTLDTVFLELPRSMDASLFFTGASRVRSRDDLYVTRLPAGFSIKINGAAVGEYNRLRATIQLPPIDD